MWKPLNQLNPHLVKKLPTYILPYYYISTDNFNTPEDDDDDEEPSEALIKLCSQKASYEG
jgi:hypothetical protein